ncbi:Ig-like domain-containing protein [Nocardioides houyundeii]|uniref:Ig-like domain-containing protein n=1 Tax=Nocardioides houyundeii TaxID=2045452 RepID=UPI00131582F5|nr:Ig-like domain-containing protein [Nocardioides houyundeii]
MAPGARRWLVLACVGALVVAMLVFALAGARSRPPRAVSHFPADGAETVPASSPVFVVFDKPLDEDARDLDFSLRDDSGASVASALRVSEAATSAELRPLEELGPGSYTAVLALPGVLEREEWSFTVPRRKPLTDGGAGPILLALSESDTTDDFYAEMLRAEGFTSFTTVDRSRITPALLADHELLVLSGDPGRSRSSMVRAWVEAGGRLVVVRPRGELAELAGQRRAGPVRDGALLEVDDPAWGAVPLRVHGAVDGIDVAPDVEVEASLVPDSGGSPALTLRDAGRGRVAGFAFDLARSVVLTRQGNPEWVGQDRDDRAPVRTNDLFFGPAEDDTGTDFVDLDHAEVPHADELMRLLTNVMGGLTAQDAPLPRLWYFPDDAEAVLVMAADDHGTPTGTADFFKALRDAAPEGCDTDRWECPRATSWLYPDAGLSPAEASAYVDEGFDLGAHVTTHCENWSASSLDQAFGASLRAFRAAYPSLPAQHGSRLHCIVWTDYLTQPTVERAWGVRLDMNYYYWPGDWVAGRPGFMTGSGLPMRFSDLDGGLLNVFQQPTHLVDEVFAGDPTAVEELIDRAQGPEEYYGAFGTHIDFSTSFQSEVIAVALERGVPMVSGQQLLDWVDGRYASRFSDLRWSKDEMTFSVVADPRAEEMLRGMLPVRALGGELLELARDGERVETTIRSVKGVKYAFFDATTGEYAARYASAS